MKEIDLHFEAGHPLDESRTVITDPRFSGAFMQEHGVRLAREVRIVDSRDRCLFEISIVGDNEIEIRSVDSHYVGDTLYGERFSVRPHASNMVTLKTLPYDE